MPKQTNDFQQLIAMDTGCKQLRREVYIHLRNFCIALRALSLR